MSKETSACRGLFIPVKWSQMSARGRIDLLSRSRIGASRIHPKGAWSADDATEGEGWSLRRSPADTCERILAAVRANERVVVHFEITAFFGETPALHASVEQPGKRWEVVEDHPTFNEKFRARLRAGESFVYGNPSTVWMRTPTNSPKLPRIDQFVLEAGDGVVDIVIEVTGSSEDAVEASIWAQVE